MQKLTVNSPIEQGGLLTCSFSGFTAGASVHIYVQGGGGLYKTASSTGSGSVSFYISESPGTYTLIAEEGSNYASAVFEVTEGSGPEPGEFKGWITAVSLPAGDSLNFEVTYEVQATAPEAYTGWHTKVTGEFNGQSGSTERTHIGTDLAQVVTLKCGTIPSHDVQGEIKLYAKPLTGDWQLLATKGVTVKVSGSGDVEIPVEEEGNGGWTVPEISTPVALGILGAMLLLIFLLPSKPPKES